MAEQYFKHTPQALSDHNQVENLAIEVEEAFLKVENDLWVESINSASIGSSIVILIRGISGIMRRLS